MTRPLLPPFSESIAAQKVRAAEDGWNSRDPKLVTQAYTDDCQWRNRSEFLSGHAEIEAFLTRKWQREHQYRLIKELWAWTRNRIAVRFAYEWCDTADDWFRSYGNENWEFAADGRMRQRIASINDVPIKASSRLFHWPLGRRPEDHLGLTELNL